MVAWLLLAQEIAKHAKLVWVACTKALEAHHSSRLPMYLVPCALQELTRSKDKAAEDASRLA